MAQPLSHLIDSHLFRMALFKWFDIIGIVLWIGALGFRLLVFRPSLKALRDPSIEERLRREEAAYTEPALRGLLVYLIVLHFITWVHQAEMMSGKPLSDILPVLPIVLTKTHFGSIWVIKLFLLLFLFILIRIRFRLRDPLLFGCGLFLCVTESLVGHPFTHGVAQGAVFSDWVHLTAVSIWIGGLLPLRRLASKGAVWMAPDRLALFLRTLIGTFSKWAIVAVALIVTTGSYNAFLFLDRHWIFDFNYGQVLLTKLLLAASAIGMGGVSRIYILPSLYRVERSAPELERRFSRLILIEVGLATVTLLLAALLTQTAPPPPPAQ
ncbi:MAG: CopD family protein [Nitrospirae bacterium]|nr:CopD family protein [Candidatus Manganitrophaceae bacterium]